MTKPTYECDHCGACCSKLIVEADWVDVLREPRIIDGAPYWSGRSVESVVHEMQDNEFKAVVLACGNPCRMLGPDKLCQIYPTRPNVCVAFAAGSEQCQQAREDAKLPPLEPIPYRAQGLFDVPREVEMEVGDGK